MPASAMLLGAPSGVNIDVVNAISVLQMRDGAACFAVLDVLPVRGATGACAVGGRCRSFARAHEPKDGGLAQSMPWTGHMHADRMCNYVFRKRER